MAEPGANNDKWRAIVEGGLQARRVNPVREGAVANRSHGEAGWCANPVRSRSVKVFGLCNHSL